MFNQSGVTTVAGLIITFLVALGLAGSYYLGPRQASPDLQNNHPDATVSASPRGSTCSLDKDCGIGMICQQICTQTYPTKCSPGKCVPSYATPSATPLGNSSGGKAPMRPY